jgi:hypothetical protein
MVIGKKINVEKEKLHNVAWPLLSDNLRGT